MKDSRFDRLSMLLGLALTAVTSTWWLASTRLALEQGTETAVPAGLALLALLNVRAMTLAVLGLHVGTLHGWRHGAATSLLLVAAPWPLVLLAWSASEVPLTRLACGEVALVAACVMLPAVGHGLSRWFARIESAMVASTSVGVAIAAAVWASRTLWAMPAP
jgi:hypothetical protein